jgi:ribosomal protein S18 acetylase RimI-like enzyme
VRIGPAEWPRDTEIVRALFREYADSLGFDLGFQDFERELRELPGDYEAPCGCVLIARAGGSAAGCMGLRRLEAGTAELKRLYVRPEFRGRGLGRSLTEAAMEQARAAGYARVRLDTVPSMTEAIELYRTLGFRPIPPYRYNPVPGTRFLELTL